MSLVAAFIFSAGMMAQENTEVSIQVKKDGKVIKDTTYQFDDAKEAKHIMKMVEVMSGGDEHLEGMHYNYTTAHAGGKHANTMVFISKDGKKTEIKEMHGDSLVWISEGDDKHVIHKHGERVVVMKKGDGETFDILMDEDGKEGKLKRVKVVVSGDEKGNWTAVSTDEEHLDKNENVYFISEEDDIKVEIREIIEESGDGEEVKVIVIRKEKDEDCEHKEDHDTDVDVKVMKKKVKK